MNLPSFSSIGLEEKTGRIYLAGLELGTTTIQELARVSGIKRPTVYSYMDDLLASGLFEQIVRGKKRLYRAADPAALEAKLKNNLTDFQSALPRLLALRTETMGAPQVRIIENESGMRLLYQEIQHANSCRAWSNIATSKTSFHDIYHDIAESVRKRGTTVKEIIADNKDVRRYARLMQKVAGPKYQVKTAPVEGIENDTLIFGNVVAIFRLIGQNNFVVRIEDKSIADTMRAIHEMSWRSARALR
jgi:sugar-specific transcriptional regulator TrmB